MSWGPDALISAIDGFVVRLALAHQDLLASGRKRDMNSAADWKEAKLPTVEEALETAARSRRRDVTSLKSAFDEYKGVAGRVVAAVRADNPDEIDASVGALLPAYDALRRGTDQIVNAARIRKTLRTVGIWMLGVAVSVTLSVFGAWYAAHLREKERLEQQQRALREAAISNELPHAGACTDKDWQRSGSLGKGDASCGNWMFEAWRAAEAFEITGANYVTRIRAAWIDPKRDGRLDVAGVDTPTSTAEYWLCEVPKGARVRITAWWSTGGRARTASTPAVFASARNKDQGPC